MKRLLLFIALTTSYYLLTTNPVLADFNQAYSDYITQYNIYRSSLSEHQSNRNKYLTYQTLTSQTDALASAKIFLQNRDRTLISYFKLLLERNDNENLKKLINDEVNFYQDHQTSIEAVGNLNDAVEISGKAKTHYPLTESIARKTIANILIGKLRNFYERQGNLEDNFKQQISNTNLERWIVSLDSKRVLALQKLTEAQTLTDQLEPKSSDELSRDFGKITLLLNDANQYLKEGNSYLVEIKDELKYGNY